MIGGSPAPLLSPPLLTGAEDAPGAAPLSAHLPCCFALVTASTVGQGGNSGFLTTLELWEALKMLTQALLIL